MIYVRPGEDEPIRQGDIFRCIPRLEASLSEVSVVSEQGAEAAQWHELADRGDPVRLVVTVCPVTAIVATQDCDVNTSSDIALCEIRPFTDVHTGCNRESTLKGFVSAITQHARSNLKWFYLPPDDEFGFSERQAADFRVVLRVSREDLHEKIQAFRFGRLNKVALAHFRERLSEFFRRYPYDEWYPLNSSELAIYQAIPGHDNANPYPWQQA